MIHLEPEYGPRPRIESTKLTNPTRHRKVCCGKAAAAVRWEDSSGEQCAGAAGAVCSEERHCGAFTAPRALQSEIWFFAHTENPTWAHSKAFNSG